MGRPVICRLCEQRIENEEPVICKVTGSEFYNKKLHLKCYEKFLNEIGNNLNGDNGKKSKRGRKKKTEKENIELKEQKKEIKKEPEEKVKKEPEEKVKKKTNKMSKEEIAERDELATYIKELFGYHVLTRRQMHKINSLKNGEIVRRGDEITKDFPYSVILLTFKAKKAEIDYALKTKNFNDEDKKFNYVMAIISNSINEVYLRWKNSEFQKRQLNMLYEAELKSQEEGGANQNEKYEFVSRGRNPYLDNPLFADLWED